LLVNDQQLQKMESGKGFIAALDQSGGSTPKALRLYGIEEDAYHNEDEMFDLIHAMRSRIIESPSFGGDRILAAILFEGTMDRQIAGDDSASYLWNKKNVVPFLKIDKGLADQADGVQLMKPIPGLDELLARAIGKGIFGTKMRSFALLADPDGVRKLIDQQFEFAEQVLAAGLVPILEPEVDIHSPQKAEAEELLRAATLDHLEGLRDGQRVMLKLTLPSVDDFYLDLVQHPKVLRVVALSGGYTRDQANELLARNHGVVASFSRALTEGLTIDQSENRFDAALDASIASIYRASTTKMD
jgi:fructose-bisphosphate aldolase, class I